MVDEARGVFICCMECQPWSRRLSSKCLIIALFPKKRGLAFSRDGLNFRAEVRKIKLTNEDVRLQEFGTRCQDYSFPVIHREKRDR